MRDENRIWSLMAKKLSGEASPAELRELQELLQDNPGQAAAMEILSAMWKPAETKDTAPGEEEAAAKQLLQRAKQQRSLSSSSHQTKDIHPIPGRLKKPRRGLRTSLLNRGKLNSYFKSSVRNLLRNKSFSLINISGLAIGIASAILLFLWISVQFDMDQFHQNKDRVYKLYNRAKINGEVQSWASTPMVMASSLKENYPITEEVVRLNWVGAFVLSAGDKHLQSQGFLADPGFFKLFSFPFEEGNPQQALTDKHGIVLTETMAHHLFGDADAMGRMVGVDSNAFTVTGILKDLPNNTQFQFDYLVPWSYTKEVGWENLSWSNNSISTYVLVKPGVTEAAANKAFKDIIHRHAPEINTEIFVHPMAKWWLWSRFENGKIAGGGIDDVILFGLIAGLLLLVACINYMNLSTARSMKRAKEVGIRKVAGAGKASLVQQFMLESVLLSLIAGLAALVIAAEALPFFNRLTGARLSIPYQDGRFWLLFLLVILMTGLIAGSYPSFYLAAYKPLHVLKGSFKSVRSLFNPRKVLVVVQFSFAIIFIICTIVIYRQIDFGRKREMGFTQDHLLYLYNKGDIQKNFPAIQQELLASGAASLVARTNSPITDIWSWENSYQWPGKAADDKSAFARFSTDGNFTSILNIPLVAGRDIDVSRYPSDTMALVLNEAAVKLTGIQHPVGQTLKSEDGTWHVVGVVKDFNPGRPYDPIRPTVIQGPGHSSWFGTVTIKLNPAVPVTASLEKINTLFRKYNPDYPFQYYFVSDAYAEKFKGLQHFGNFAGLFAGLTIFISCLGIFALAAYMAENRIKEIGVRKILGASVAAITTLLSKDFLRPVLVSFLIAAPIAGWLMNNWLGQFAYRTNISWWIFAVSGIAATLIAWITVSYHSVRAALTNPVKSLRSE